MGFLSTGQSDLHIELCMGRQKEWWLLKCAARVRAFPKQKTEDKERSK